jgi:hypothetical protein
VTSLAIKWGTPGKVLSWGDFQMDHDNKSGWCETGVELFTGERK